MIVIFDNYLDGIAEVRDAYKSSNKVNDYEVMSTMADMEFRSLDHSLPLGEKYKRFRDIMEKACQLHGKANLGKTKRRSHLYNNCCLIV